MSTYLLQDPETRQEVSLPHPPRLGVRGAQPGHRMVPAITTHLCYLGTSDPEPANTYMVTSVCELRAPPPLPAAGWVRGGRAGLGSGGSCQGRMKRQEIRKLHRKAWPPPAGLSTQPSPKLDAPPCLASPLTVSLISRANL